MASDKRSRRKRLLIALSVLLLLGLGEYWLYPSFVTSSGLSKDQGRNGLWLRYKWYFGENTDFGSLANRLQRGHFRYAFFHVRFVNRDGSLHFRYLKQAQGLNREMKTRAPDVLRIAWVFAGNHAIDGNVDLRQKSVRTRMVDEAKWLVQKCGFDGVQWDYEICPDGDLGFLRLLEETRAALPKAFLSTAVPSAYSWPFVGLGWSEGYFRLVAATTDQMAVMGYDTGAYFPRWYVRHLQGSVRVIGQAAQNTKCKILMGLPTYGDGPPSQNPRSENLRMGLAAVLGTDWPQAFEGVALFADYTIDEEEWAEYRKAWVRQ
jgi:hypothetical protein